MGKDYKKQAIKIGINVGISDSDADWLASRLEKADKYDDLVDCDILPIKGTRVIIYKWKPSGVQSMTGKEVLNIILSKDEQLKIAIGAKVAGPVS